MTVEAPERIWVDVKAMTASSVAGRAPFFGVGYVRIDKLEELAAEAKEAGRFGAMCLKRTLDAEAALAEKDKEIAALREALEAMLEPYEDDPCRYDHHGYCQTHFLQEDCCVAKTRATLARNAGGTDG